MKTRSLITALIGLAPICAMAHGSDANHAHSFASGLLHPLSGWDHWLSFMLLGVLAARVCSLRNSPASLASMAGLFMVAMAAGFAAASRYLGLPYPAFAIAGLLIALGFVFALMTKPSLMIGLVITAAMGYVHGYVHGIELAGALPAAAGMLVASALLACLGTLCGRLMQRSAPLQRYGAKLAGGVALLLGAGLVYQP